MKKKNQSASSYRWLQERNNDPFVKKREQEKVRSRAYFKLESIQQQDKLIKPGIDVLELGSAPGGWTEYLARELKGQGNIIACDLLPMRDIPGVTFIQGDFCDEAILNLILSKIEQNKIDLILSDMAPNLSGNIVTDQARAMYLAELALDICQQVLKRKGAFVVKLFQGEGFDPFLIEVRKRFTTIKMRKPEASRSRSREVYLVATGFKI